MTAATADWIGASGFVARFARVWMPRTAGTGRSARLVTSMTEHATDEEDSSPTKEEMLDVELVLGAGRLNDHQVRLDVSAAKVVNREEGRLEISLADGEMDEYLAELGLKNCTDEVATDNGGDSA